MNRRTTLPLYLAAILAMLAFLLSACSSSTAPQWKVTSTGLKHADVDWCDATHVVAQYFEGEFPRSPVVVTLDIDRPTSKTRVMFPGPSGGNRKLTLIGCEAGALVLKAFSPVNPAEPAIYAFAPGHAPALLLIPKAGAIARGDSRLVNVRDKLIASPMPREATSGGYKADEQCASDVMPGFRLLCFDSGFERLVALQRFVIVNYLWKDPVSATGPGNQRVSVKNPGARLYDKSGKAIVKATFLYDLDKRLIARLDEDERFQLYPESIQSDPQQAWLFSPCKLIDKSNKSSMDFDRVCRYRLDGAPHRWEEIFVFHSAAKARGVIRRLSVDLHGNVFFDTPGASGTAGGIRRFDAASKTIERIVATREHEYFGNPIVSPDGRSVLFEKSNMWMLARQ